MYKTISNNHFNKKIVIITGELSGEIHACHVVKKIRESLDIEFSGMGSKKLEEAGVHIVHDYREISLTGINEIIPKLKHIWTAFNRIKNHLKHIKPSLIILVDFPGFNMRIAKTAKKYGIPVLYFIPPQIWAWRQGRIKTMKNFIDKIICILPFEKQLYDAYNIDATYVGHPFVNTVKPTLTKEEFFEKAAIKSKTPIITIMPGSRSNEIKKHMPVLIKAIERIALHFNEPAILLPLAEGIDQKTVETFNTGNIHINYLKGLTYDALSYCDIAIIASGSATMEAAILGTTTIVIYKISKISYIIAKLLVKSKYISLPNIIAGKEVFPEFIQHLDPEKIAEKALYMLNNGSDKINEELIKIKTELDSMDSYELTKNTIIDFLKQTYGTIS
ncbi:MAG: lipid-A-disaccharide synthase [Proteobacteria bacterium]|nr:lipid-A-disaccharide synthase [Pseudomonadota bacterium]